MSVEQSAKLFATRDHDFDFCRSFLVVSMIFTHVFQNFYLPDYNRRLTFFVTIGFVLVSGFVIGGRSSEQVGRSPWKHFTVYLRRFAKVLQIYIVCNIPIVILEPSRLELLKGTPFPGMVWMILSGEGSAVFGFDILPAIALTTLFAWVVMGLTKRIRAKALLLSIVPFLLLWVLEFSIEDNFIAIRLLLIGIFGCLLGKAASYIDWRLFLEVMADMRVMAVLGIIIFSSFIAMALRYWPNGPILLWRHLIPTALLLFFVYMLSHIFKIGGRPWARFLNAALAEYMLFSYIFHIGLIKLSLLFIESVFNFQETLLIAFLFSGTTIAICHLLDMGRKRVLLLSRMYSFFFGL